MELQSEIAPMPGSVGASIKIKLSYDKKSTRIYLAKDWIQEVRRFGLPRWNVFIEMGETMNRIKIWIAGAEGRLGGTIAEMIDCTEYRVLTSDLDVDITDVGSVTTFMEVGRPEVVVNCAALSDEEKCEEDLVRAYHVNAIGARNLAVASRKIGAKIIHLSTDDVFAGSTVSERTEFDQPDPVSAYGKSKLAGEAFVRELNPKHIIVRSSWVYGTTGEDFVKYVLRQAKAGTPFQVRQNQISSPTSAKELAVFIMRLIGTKEYGIFHAACEGGCSRHELARTILLMKGLSQDEADQLAIPANDNQVRCTLLRNLMMEITGIYRMPEWKGALKEFLDSCPGL